jgi:hypothetical protein
MVMHRTECTASLSNACVGASIGLIRWPINTLVMIKFGSLISNF